MKPHDPTDVPEWYRATVGERNEWMPTGEGWRVDVIYVPWDMPKGIYQLQICIVDRQSHEPKVNLAIEGRNPEGWYPVGNIEIRGTDLK